MANGIKIGSLNIDSLKVGSGDCTVYLGDTLLYSGSTPPTPHDYLTFRALEDGTFKLIGNSINYSVDNGNTWTELASNTNSPTVQSGQTIMWKGTLSASSSNGIGTFSSSGQFEAEGNIMSLKYGDNFSGQTTLTDKYAFCKLFSGCTGLTSAENLVLPATTLTQTCYQSMFQGCTSLEIAPTTLPATTLTVWCYGLMFSGCSSLTTAPELPATTLAASCYNAMFYNCSSLTTAPELPATTLEKNCYNSMFSGCENLTTAPELLATTLADSCYSYMFYNCSSLETAPALQATTLANYCYESMFKGCSNLSEITCLATDIYASDCTYEWVTGVSSSGTFTKAASMFEWTTGDSGIPDDWEIEDYQE